MHSLSYKIERDTEFKDTVVTLLIDNSGSMRGRPISIAAISADILARTLERCRRQDRDPRLHHPRVEGRAGAREVARRGPPAAAGPAQRPAPHHLQAGRRAVAPRAQESRPDDARGAAQGEYRRRGAALGAQPADRRPEERKILMVISDGAPVDDSTLSVNSGSISSGICAR
jgi:cobaltochelatase CobT